MSDWPQYVVGSPGKRCISKRRPAVICGMLRDGGYPHSRHKVLSCSHREEGMVRRRCLPRMRSQVWQEACLSTEIVSCSAVRERTKNVPGFTTDYKEPMKRSADYKEPMKRS